MAPPTSTVTLGMVVEPAPAIAKLPPELTVTGLAERPPGWETLSVPATIDVVPV